MRDECEHGSLRRSCEICERDAELATLRARIAAAIERSITLWHEHDRARRGNVYADGYDSGIKRAAEEIRAVLEGR